MKTYENCVLYLRKSTNTEDKQTISLETQAQYCEELIKKKGFRIIETIEEKRSAKASGTRPGFKDLIKLCNKGWIDYVIAYDPTRISRDTMDAAIFTELINKKKIKGFYSADTGQLFDWLNIFSAMMLGISFLVARADNQMRSSNVKSKMTTKHGDGYIITRMPFWYKKVSYLDKEWEVHRKVQIDEKEAELVRLAFRLRAEWKTTPQIAKVFWDSGFKKYPAWIDKLLKNEFYVWIQDGKFWRAEISKNKNEGYEPLVSVELFEKVNGIHRDYKRERNVSFPAYFRKLVFDADGIPLTPYQTENKYGVRYTYYRAQNRSRYTINVSEEKLFEVAWDYMGKFKDLPQEVIIAFNQQLSRKLKEWEEQLSKTVGTIQRSITTCDEKIKNIDDKYALNQIGDELYMEMRNRFLDERKQFEAKIKRLKNEKKDMEELIQNLVKLLENLSRTYERGTFEEKSKILKSIQVKLISDPLGTLYTKENSMLEALSFQRDLSIGSVTENRTPITGMRILCPNR